MTLQEQKQLMIKGGYKGAEPNMVMETKEEVIDTIAKKDFDKTSLELNQLKEMGRATQYLFKIKKGDPIQVIKTTRIGNIQTDVLYDLKKHNGKNYIKTLAEKSFETSNQPKLLNSTVDGGTFVSLGFGNSKGIGTYFSEYNIPKDVVEDTSIVETTKELLSPNSKKTSSLFKIVLLGVVGFVIYKVVNKKQ